MSFDRRFDLWCLGACLSFVTGGCADFERGSVSILDAAVNGADGPDAGAGANTETDLRAAPTGFAPSHRLLVAGCGDCHGPGGAGAGSGLHLRGDPTKDRQGALNFINREQPATSRLLTKGAGQSHGGGTIFPVGSPEHQVLLQWISQGAPP